MNARDYDYIDNRLTSGPGDSVFEAIGRLKAIGRPDLAERVQDAAKALTDELRAVRRIMQNEHRRGAPDPEPAIVGDGVRCAVCGRVHPREVPCEQWR